MSGQNLHAVTGAFGYSGRYIAKRLLEAGERVITLTNSPRCENPFGDIVKAYPFHFEKPKQLSETLEGVSVLYNTYWIRFNYRTFGHALAVENSRKLIKASREAGVRRIVHVSITNPSQDSNLEYFRGKAIVEREITQSGLTYAILRPAVLFGEGDILINNIAWTLRRFPVFGLFGDGSYKIQPIHVQDLARIAVEAGAKEDKVIINAIGPETFTYRELVEQIGRIIGKARPTIPFPPRLAYLAGVMIGRCVGDVMITWPEVQGLMSNLLYVDAPPAGRTPLTVWAKENAETLGYKYANELSRRRVNHPTHPTSSTTV